MLIMEQGISIRLSEPAFALGVINQDREKAMQVFRELMKCENEDDGVSLRHISRVTGLSVDIVFNA